MTSHSFSFSFSVTALAAFIAAGCAGGEAPSTGANAESLTCDRYVESARLAAAGEELSLEQLDDLDIVRDAFDSMPAELRAEGDAILAEALALGIPGNELAERVGELSTAPSATLERLSSEYSAQLGCVEELTVVAGMGGRIGSQESALLGFLAAGAAVLLCGGRVLACTEDSQEEHDTVCGEPSSCPAGQVASAQCCARKLHSDTVNCGVTCGTNGPDGDYENCCRLAPQGQAGEPSAI
ncbi:MAG: hypothetical protein ACI9KE_004531 [Polyangiales bacterium]|jgi:hypothetical protein